MITIRTKSKRQQKQESPLHFRRIELKYLMRNQEVPELIQRLSPYTEQDPYLLAEGNGRTSYPVTSLYFDSYDCHSLLEKDAGLLSRRKVRLRTYNEHFSGTTPCFLELKRRHDSIISKDRLSLKVGRLQMNLPLSQLLDYTLSCIEAKEAVTAEVQLLRSWYNLQPTALVRYQRIPFVGKEDSTFRLTIDHHLEGAWKPSNLSDPDMHICMSQHCVLELKFNHTVPAWFHHIIQDHNLERISYSKYARTVEHLEPVLS